MRADFSSMLDAIFVGFLVASAVILSPARPSELSSRCGAVPFRAILAICLFLASWMVSRAQHSSNLDHQNRSKMQPSRETIETKTHRKIKHILGQKQHDKVGRLLVSELYTVGAGGWSGFPSHKHDTNRIPKETRHDETYNFRFKPNWGSGLQMLQRSDNEPGDAYHIVDGSTICIDHGYHPCCVLPGYEMYYFTILGGLSQRSLIQYFQPTHAYQVETIPGIKDMIAKFK